MAASVHQPAFKDPHTARHIYNNWPYLVSSLAEDQRALWKSPFYEGDVDGYTRDQCPQSLGYLGRAIMVMIGRFFTLDDADMIVEGIRKVAGAVL